MIGNLLALGIAAILEIAGCFACWAWLRRGASPAIVAVGTHTAIVITGALAIIGFASKLRLEWSHPDYDSHAVVG